MAILEHEVRSADRSSLTSSQRHLFSRDEYYSLAKPAGFGGNLRTELIEGEVIDMAPIGPWHASLNDPLALFLRAAFGVGHAVRTQAPISITTLVSASEPQPDIVVVTGSWRDYLSRHPEPADVSLIVEIADSTLSYDRTIKTTLYALAGIPEYWIVNLVDRQLEVYRDPVGAAYAAMTILRVGDSVAPLGAPGKSIALADFMP